MSLLVKFGPQFATYDLEDKHFEFFFVLFVQPCSLCRKAE